MGKIVTVTLNPCMDKTITVKDLKIGGTNKVRNVKNNVSGKGINVSSVLQNLGIETVSAGFDYVGGGITVKESLQKKGMKSCLIEVKQPLRTNIKIFDADHKIMTEFNECGNPVGEEQISLFLESLEEVIAGLEKDSLLVLAGSAPEGVPEDIYQTIIEMAEKYEVKTILDTSGKLLENGIIAKPFAIKPNIDEMETILGHNVDSLDDITACVRKLLAAGIQYACVSLGGKGALFYSEAKAYYAEALSLEIKGVQGAGDSMVAGMCKAFMENKGEEDVLRYAMAAAAGSLTHEGTDLCEKEDFETMLPLVNIKEIR